MVGLGDKTFATALFNHRFNVILGTTLEFCCYGYLIDMLDILRINMSLTFDVHLVADDTYGIQVPVSQYP